LGFVVHKRKTHVIDDDDYTKNFRSDLYGSNLPPIEKKSKKGINDRILDY